LNQREAAITIRLRLEVDIAASKLELASIVSNASCLDVIEFVIGKPTTVRY
jgi:hypothetical protein